MTFIGGIRRRLPLVLTSVSGGAVVALVATVALVSQGYAHQKLDLDDGSVWVPSGSHQLVGHANTQIGALSTAFTVSGAGVSLLQDPTHLIVHDKTANTLKIVSPADAKITHTVPLPNGVPDVLDGGNSIAVYLPATGDAWVVPKDDAAAFNAKTVPALSLGVDATMAVDTAGHFVGYSAKSGKLTAGTLGGDGQTTSSKVAFSTKARNVQASLVGGKAVLYNPGSDELWVDGSLVELRSSIRKPSTAELMKPSVDADRLLIAHSAGLVSVRLDDHSVENVGSSSGASGVAAAPVTVDGCAYAAWSGGVGYRMCGPGSGSGSGRDAPQTVDLPSSKGATDLSLLVNGRRVVLNEPASGKTWSIQNGGRLIDNWNDFVDANTKIQTEQDSRDVPPQVDPQQKPPIAVDDVFGVRAGRANTLPVLLNDSDPNGDPLIVSKVTALAVEFGHLDIVDNAQKIQLTMRPDASGTQSFRYTIDDGHGGTAEATVTVTVKGPDQNGPPKQARPTRTSVASGGTANLNVLGDWVDPESDPIYLKAVVATAPDRVSFTPDGQVEFTDAGGGPGVKSVELVVSDGRADGTGSLSITVGASGSVPIIAESFSVTGYAGQDIAVSPLPNVRGGTGKIALNGVTPARGDTTVTVTSDYTNGTFVLNATQAGTHELEYSVTDGRQNASGTVRVEVAAPPSAALPPVTQPTTAFVYLRATKSVDVLANDTDPAGGVLSILSVTEVPSSLQVGIADQRSLSVTLNRALDGPASFTYIVTNGKAKAVGTVTIVQIPEPVKLQPPIANPDTANVRVNSVVDIPVLANDLQPDGKPLLLSDKLVQTVPAGAGTLFVAGDRLRYLAPSKPGTFTAAYSISTTDGQSATASVTITVRDIDAANNRPPAPQTVEARTMSGQRVRIPIPLAGIDPDGDTVTLVGQASAPHLGAISKTGTDFLEYTAGPYSTGTDVFQYSVVDGLGAVGTGTIRVGVSPSTGQITPPIANDDAVVARPGADLHVNVTDNDIDPQGGTLTVTNIETSGGLKATHTADTVSLKAPTAEGGYGIVYTIQNPRGGTASAWLYVQVDKNAALVGPVAHDIHLGLGDIDNRSTVEVDALGAVTFSEGTRSGLSLNVPSGFPSTTAQNGKLQISVQKHSQIIPFVVARKDDPRVTSMAFVWIPGTADAKPELKTGAPTLTVASGDPLTIKVADYVLVANGKKPTVTDAASVSATFSNGAAPLVDDSTLRYTSAKDYFGPASITFTVTDATGGSGGNQATLTLPIRVTPKTNQPPVVNGVSLTIEGGGQTSVDLSMLTDYPYPDARDQLVFAAESGAKNVVTTSVSGTQLTIRAADGVTLGSSAKIVVSVRDKNGPGTSGVISVTIVKSTRPLVSPVNDSVTIKRGDSTTVNVLSNDEATNPFPGHALRVVSVDTSTVPAGIGVGISADKSTVSISVGKAAPTGTLTIPYKVSDITNDPDRFTSANIIVNIQDVPDAPSAAPGVGSPNVDDASVVVTIPSTYPNNSPITKYLVKAVGSGPGASCDPGTLCVVKGLTYGVPFQFTVSAVNALGEGAPSVPSAPIVVDSTPAAPAPVSIAPNRDQRSGAVMDLAWGTGQQPAKASAPVSFHVRVVGGGATLLDRDYPVAVTSDSITNATPGVQYTISVSVTNKSSAGPEQSASNTAMSAPVFTSATVDREGAGGHATVHWTIAGGAGDVTYSVIKGDSGSGPCTALNGQPASGGAWTDHGSIDDGAMYTVFAKNALFCTSAVAGPLRKNAPSVPDGAATLAANGPRKDILVSGINGGGSATGYQYALVPTAQGTTLPAEAQWQDIATSGGWVSGPGHADAKDNTAYTVYLRSCGLFECSDPKSIGQNLTPTPPPAPAA